MHISTFGADEVRNFRSEHHQDCPGLNTWFEPVLVRLTDTGVLLLDEALGAV